MQFHERLKEYRKIQGLTQEELAEKLHVSRSAVAKWENGLGLPSDDSLEDIAALFGVDCGDLLSDRETETIIVEKNGKLFRQKKWLIGLIAIAAALLIAAAILLGVFLTREKELPLPGSGDSVITGVGAGFNAESETLKGSQKTEVYHLKTGERYEFSSWLNFHGSKNPRLGKGDVKIYYDTRLFTFDEGEFSEGGRESTPVDLYPFYFTCLDIPAYTEIFVTAVGFWCKVAVIID